VITELSYRIRIMESPTGNKIRSSSAAVHLITSRMGFWHIGPNEITPACDTMSTLFFFLNGMPVLAE